MTSKEKEMEVLKFECGGEIPKDSHLHDGLCFQTRGENKGQLVECGGQCSLLVEDGRS